MTCNFNCLVNSEGLLKTKVMYTVNVLISGKWFKIAKLLPQTAKRNDTWPTA